MKKTDSKYIVDLIWIVFSLPFVVTDNLVCAKINQLIWDQIPMDFSKLCMLAGLFVVYLLVYRVMVGCFYWRQTRLIKRISTNLKDAVYRYHVYHSKCYAEKDEISNIINHDIPILETDFYGALLSCVICLITAFLAIVMTFSTNFYYGLFCCAAMFISIFGVRNILKKWEQSYRLRVMQRMIIQTSCCKQQKEGNRTTLYYV